MRSKVLITSLVVLLTACSGEQWGPRSYTEAGLVRIGSDCPRADPILATVGLRRSADGLPRLGQTRFERVRDVVLETGHQLAAQFHAIEARITPRRGEVWDGRGDGDYRIVAVEDHQIELVLGPGAPCPDSPYSWDGVPVVFTREYSSR